jgi:AraC-like DNA-binding protein
MIGPDRNADPNCHTRTSAPVGKISLSVRAVQPVLVYLAGRGHDSSAFLNAHGVDPTIFRNPDARLPHAVAISLWQAACRLTNDSNLGLHVAEGIRAGVYGALDYAVRTCETLGEGLRRLSRYHRFLHDVAETTLTVDRERAILSHHLPLPGGAPRPVSECVLAGWLLTSRQAIGLNWIPLEVRFPHSVPDDISEQRRVCGCKLQFECKRSELVFGREVLDAPLVKADAALQAILETQVVAVIEKLPKGEATTDAVRRHLAGELGKGQPTLEQIAPRLHMSPRTLHRRLEDEGTSFRQVLSEVRRELASRHLMERRLAIGEIAFLLGFSEPSAFHRAFKRWTGHAPLTYRELALAREQRGADIKQ